MDLSLYRMLPYLGVGAGAFQIPVVSPLNELPLADLFVPSRCWLERLHVARLAATVNHPET